MAERKDSELLHIRLDPDTYRVLREYAVAHREPVTAVVRRFVERGLATNANDAQADALTASIRRAIEPTRKLAYFAAREATKSRYWAEGGAGISYQLTNSDEEVFEKWLRDKRAGAWRLVRKVLDEKNPEQTVKRAIEEAEMIREQEQDELVELPAEQAELFQGGDETEETEETEDETTDEDDGELVSCILDPDNTDTGVTDSVMEADDS